jgi:hypothetical protein
MFRASMTDVEYSAGIESLEVELFREDQIPWQQLAFPVIVKTLKQYYQDKKNGQFNMHVADISPPPK